MIVVINNCQLIGLKTVRFLKYFSVSQFAAVQGCSGQDLKCLILSLKSQSLLSDKCVEKQKMSWN